MTIKEFNSLVKASLKSEETEEWIDIWFTRPVGMAFALAWRRIGVRPNTITILSIFLGLAAAYMFWFTDLAHNLAGVVLLMLANFCDSTDGQLARLTNQKSLLGRALDGIAGDCWFFAIYVALCLRIMPQTVPGTSLHWGIGIWLVAAIAGFVCHTPQASLADYYRQLHLYFLLGREGSELDNSTQQFAIYKSLPKDKRLDRLFHLLYGNYCKSQERRTPNCQRFLEVFRRCPSAEVKREFLQGSRPLMPLANILSFNVRAIVLYLTCLMNIPWLYFLFEIIVLMSIYVFMHHRHERLCAQLTKQLENDC